MKKIDILKNQIIQENAVLKLMIGLCPALAVSTMAENAIGLGAATTFVLLGSNIVVSLIRHAVPSKVRIPCYIVLIASFTVMVEMIVRAFAYPLYLSLGIFLPLITTNCLIFARAEIFANKNKLSDSIVDAIGAGVGFTLALLAIATVREILGSGEWFGISIPWLSDNTFSIFSLAPGGFIVFAFLIALINKISKNRAIKHNESGCEGCVSAVACGKYLVKGEDE